MLVWHFKSDRPAPIPLINNACSLTPHKGTFRIFFSCFFTVICWRNTKA